MKLAFALFVLGTSLAAAVHGAPAATLYASRGADAISSYSLSTGDLLTESVTHSKPNPAWWGQASFGAHTVTGELLVVTRNNGAAPVPAQVDLYAACDLSGQRSWAKTVITSSTNLTGIAIDSLTQKPYPNDVYVSGTVADAFTEQYSLSSGSLEATLFHGGTGGMSFDSKTGLVYIACYVCGKVLIWDSRSNQGLTPYTWSDLPHPVDASFDHESRTLIVTDATGAVMLWDVDAQRTVFRAALPNWEPQAAVLHEGTVFVLVNNTQVLTLNTKQTNPQPTPLIKFDEPHFAIFKNVC